MGKRGRILIAAVAMIVVGVVGWSIFREWLAPSEPMYKGKPLSYWLQGHPQLPGYGTSPSQADVDAAIHEAGTNAIPTLLRLLQTQHSPLKIQLERWAYRIPYIRNHYPPSLPEEIMATYGFRALGQDAVPAVPDLVKILNGNPSSNLFANTTVILGNIGPAASGAIPTLLRIVTGTNQYQRWYALNTLGRIRSDPDAVVPILIAALRDPAAEIRATAAGGLMYFGTDARPAVPTLVDIISEPDGGSNSAPAYPGIPVKQNTQVRDVAKQTLRIIDPKTYSVLVTNVLPVPAWN